MKLSLAEATKDLVNKTYELGKIDCIHMVYNYLNTMIKMPTEYNGLTLENYKDFFKLDPDAAREAMVEFLSNILDEIKIIEMLPGDIVVLTYCFSPIFLGIVLANGMVLICSSEGIVSAPLGHYKIERIFRCPPHR